MPIQSEDIKILKSAVMADVPEGGGGMTGNAVVDGLSNAVFNDISEDNRAHGAFHVRKLFGIAHTDDVDTLLGTGWAILKPPADPNVDVTVFQTDGWFDERAEAIRLVESYLVKGPRLLCRVQDTHYAGTSVLQLYNPQPATSFPPAGSSIILRNPDGTEQRLRATLVTLSTAIAFDDAGAYTVNLATCELSAPLSFDLLGAPVQRTPPNSETTATVFSTVPATGAQFDGVKALDTAVVLGSEPIRHVTVDGGIFAQLVPATTVPTPVADIYPLVQRPTLSRTAAATLTIVTAAVALTAGTVLQLPTAAEPGTLTLEHGGTNFTTTAAGVLLQGTTVVGVVDWAGRTLTMAGTSPNYGTYAATIVYKPATVAGATVHSLAHVITDANQNTGFVAVMEPPPAPGTYSLDYMAQNRWYQISDDGTGKVSGGDSAYGSGTVSYVTGSFSGSMGALPDVGSTVIQSWGEAASARAATGLPTRALAVITLTKQPEPGTLALEWPSGGATYNASVSATGVVTGPAEIGPVKRTGVDAYAFTFSPDNLPDGPVTVTFNEQTESAAFTNDGAGAYTLSGAPIAPGSVRFQVLGTSGAQTRVYNCYSSGTQVIADGVGVIGSINNTTGAMLLNGAGTQDVTSWTSTRVSRSMAIGGTGTFYGPNYYYKRESSTITFALDLDGVIQIGYLPAAGAVAQSLAVAPDWRLELDPPLGLELVTTDAAFTWAGVVHFLRSGVVYRGWNAVTGATAAVGAASSSGLITLGATAPGLDNAVVWANAAHDARGSLDVLGGVFRVASAPIQAGLFQLQSGALVGTANSGGILSGDFEGLVDSQRGVVRWTVAGLGATEAEGDPVRADEVTYNAVFLQYVPLDTELLGVDTAGLPADGRVPIFRAGGGIYVHHTDVFELPEPVVHGTAYSVGRNRVASLVLRDAIGTRLPVALYETDKNAGTVTVLVGADISTYALPLKAEHRVQDELQVTKADISGRLDLAGALSHDYPVPGSYVSSKLRQGDKFARVYGYADRATWLGTWDETLAGDGIAAAYNDVDHPITTTNRGAITERWAAVFNSGTTTVNIIGEGVGQIATGVAIAATIAPINPVTLVPYFSIPATGWGGGRSAGNVLLWETQACGAPAWVSRSVLPGAAEVLDDAATIAYMANVDTP